MNREHQTRGTRVDGIRMTIAALDLGRRRIGVAVTDAASMGAYPVGIVERRALKKDLDGDRRDAARPPREHDRRRPAAQHGWQRRPRCRSARKFAASLADALGVTVEMFDERLTSFEARERLADMPARKGARKRGIDALAAVVILEGWMQAHPDKIPRDRG